MLEGSDVAAGLPTGYRPVHFRWKKGEEGQIHWLLTVTRYGRALQLRVARARTMAVLDCMES